MQGACKASSKRRRGCLRRPWAPLGSTPALAASLRLLAAGYGAAAAALLMPVLEHALRLQFAALNGAPWLAQARSLRLILRALPPAICPEISSDAPTAFRAVLRIEPPSATRLRRGCSG